MYKCFDFHFLVSHVAPGKVWACLCCAQLGFPPSKVRRYPKMFDVIPSLPIYKFPLLALIGLDNSGVLCDSPSTCLSENQYIWLPESWVVKC